MNTILKISDKAYDELMAHLLPPKSTQEQAAFLFAEYDKGPPQARFNVVKTRVLKRSDFVVQEGDYIELQNETQAGLIKQAHDLNACLVEIHSHLGPWPAAFSYADRIGLRETLPHMWWRLKGKPYLALVVTELNFDALVWIDNSKTPNALDRLIAGGRLLRPTNLSLEGWG